MKKYYIFDMDGVLVDSEPIYKEIMEVVLKELGLDVSYEYQCSLMGMSGRPMWEKIVKDFSLPNDMKYYFEFHKKIFMREIINKEVKAVEGIYNLLKELKNKGFGLAVASSAERELIEYYLTKTSLINQFEVIVSGAELERSKPFPDIFLKASSLLGANPLDCIVIEDSANGVEAAKRAGMYCIGFDSENSQNQDLSKADIVVKQIKDIKI